MLGRKGGNVRKEGCVESNGRGVWGECREGCEGVWRGV